MSPSNTDFVLAVEGLTVSFDGFKAVNDLSFYVDENEIETAKEVVVKSTVNKSKIKIYIIQQVDRKIDLDLIHQFILKKL